MIIPFKTTKTMIKTKKKKEKRDFFFQFNYNVKISKTFVPGILPNIRSIPSFMFYFQFGL